MEEKCSIFYIFVSAEEVTFDVMNVYARCQEDIRGLLKRTIITCLDAWLLYKTQRPEAFTRRCSVKKLLLKSLAKFTGKHLCQNLFFNKVAGLRSVALLKKGLWHRCFVVNVVKFLRITFLIEHLRWLLLKDTQIFQ